MFDRVPHRVSALTLALALIAPGAYAQVTAVPQANTKAPGVIKSSALSPELQQVAVARGAMALENATGVYSHYGYLNDGPMIPTTPGSNVEAQKTEPDKNTYLVLHHQAGADVGYDYGSHFLFQGHEGGKLGYLTRINLDADAAHRVTLMASADVNGKALPTYDGSTWNPFAQRLLLTAEGGTGGGVWQATVGYPSQVEDISGVMGRGGYEGVQTDNDGNVWIVEDVGGKNGAANPNAKQPNSFVYRFVPTRRHDLKAGGKLQALQVVSARSGAAIAFHAGDADGDIKSDDRKDLHTYGQTFKTNWVTLHDTAVDGFEPFDANALAKARAATPFKRPENGVFRPGTAFREFYFTETGDTNANTEAGAEYGGFGGVYKLTQHDASSNSGTLSIFYRSDVAHSGLDNIQFWSANKLAVTEDAGDTLHKQRNALDSAYLFDVWTDYSSASATPLRFLAEGRDASATLDSLLSGTAGFNNDGDNEITGIHISDGHPGVQGLLGYKVPRPFRDGWRVFYTQQHGDNITYEIVPASRVNPGREDGREREWDRD